MKKKPPVTMLLAITVAVSFLLASIFGTPQTFGAKVDSDITRRVKFTQLWSFTSDKSLVNSPVIENGFVYATSVDSSSEVTLYCLNASSGIQIWNSTGLHYTYAVQDAHVYIGSSVIPSTVFTVEGVVTCLNAYTGARVWNYSYGARFGKPVVNGDVVYVGGFDIIPRTLTPRTFSGFIFAFNALTGTRIWDFQGAEGTRFEDNSLFIAGTTLYALSAAYSSGDASWHSGIYAFNANTGEPLWNYTTLSRFNFLRGAGNTIYVVYESGVFALDRFSGERLWTYSTGTSAEPPILNDNTIYMVSDDGQVYALNASDGTEIWKYSAETSLGDAQFANGYLYVGSPEGVYCFDAPNGAVVWHFAADDFATSSATYPTQSNDLIYVGWAGPQSFTHIAERNFYALDALSGEKLGNYSLEYTMLSSPTIVDGVVFIGASSISERHVDYGGPGAVIALNSTIRELSPPNPPLPPPPSSIPPSPAFPAAILTVISVIVIVAAVVLLVAFLFLRKRAK